MTSLVAQMVKCLSAMRKTWVQSLGWEDSLEKEMATHSSTLVFFTALRLIIPKHIFTFCSYLLSSGVPKSLSLSVPSFCCPVFPDDLTLGLQLALTDILTHS